MTFTYVPPTAGSWGADLVSEVRFHALDTVEGDFSLSDEEISALLEATSSDTRRAAALALRRRAAMYATVSGTGDTVKVGDLSVESADYTNESARLLAAADDLITGSPQSVIAFPSLADDPGPTFSIGMMDF